MAFEKNIAVLKEAIARRAFITPIANHRNPDGTLNVAQFKEKWNREMAAFERIPLWEDCPGFDQSADPLQEPPYIVFIPSETGSRKTILISHGGGFEIRTGCEGPNIAQRFRELGYNTAILTYRMMPAYSRLDALNDIRRAVRVLRFRKSELGIDGKIAVMGFSAGAMLSGNCATLYDFGEKASPDPIERESSRPDAAVICYGAFSEVSFVTPFGSDPEQANLHGSGYREKFLLAPEKHVDPDTPPFFIWQTLGDDGRYGINLVKALSDARVPYELHIFEGGAHGIGIADGENDLGISDPHIARWVTLCDEWLEKHGLK